MHSFLSIHEEVTEALSSKRPVVALESTIIAHGMPYPQNVETALQVEKVIRENGAIPATIACINGKIQVGLSSSQLEELATSKNVLKLSRRDLPIAISQKRIGATTVAATMIGAEMAGIRVFATGGINGFVNSSLLIQCKPIPCGFGLPSGLLDQETDQQILF